MLDEDFSAQSRSNLGNVSDFEEEKINKFEGDFKTKAPKDDDEDGEKWVAKFFQYAEAKDNSGFWELYISSLFANLRSTQRSHFKTPLGKYM